MKLKFKSKWIRCCSFTIEFYQASASCSVNTDENAPLMVKLKVNDQ